MRVTIDRIERDARPLRSWLDGAERAHTDERTLSSLASTEEERANGRKRALLSPYLAFKFPSDFRYR